MSPLEGIPPIPLNSSAKVARSKYSTAIAGNDVNLLQIIYKLLTSAWHNSAPRLCTLIVDSEHAARPRLGEFPASCVPNPVHYQNAVV